MVRPTWLELDARRPVVWWAALTLFVFGISLWTWKLLEPIPVPESFVSQLRDWSDLLPFLLAKTLHFSGYAFLSGLLVLLLGSHWRLGVALMILHGLGTEIGQTFVPNRTGKVTDVLLDSAGIVTGAVLMRWMLKKPSPEPPPEVRPE